MTRHNVRGGRFKNTYELLNLRALKISMLYKNISFNVWVRYFVWNFKGYLWNSIQNILPIHWKMWILFTGAAWALKVPWVPGGALVLLSGVPDFFDRNKILSGGDLSHYQVPHCIRVFFYFVWFVFIRHNFQFYFELCTYCNILDIYLSYNLNFVNHLLLYMKLLNYLFFNMFGSVLECCEFTGVSLLWPWLIKWK